MSKGFSTPEECFQYLFCVKRDLDPDIHLLPKPAQSTLSILILLFKAGMAIGMLALPWVGYILAQKHQDTVFKVAISFSALWIVLVPMSILIQYRKKEHLRQLPRGVVFNQTSGCFESPRHGWAIKKATSLYLVHAVAHERVDEGNSWTDYKYQLVYLRDQDACYPVHLWLPAFDSVDLDLPLRTYCSSNNLEYEQAKLNVHGLVSDRDRTETLGRLFTHS